MQATRGVDMAYTKETYAAIDQALADYAAEHGRNWKSKLNLDWLHGRSRGLLALARVSLGPSGLNHYKVKRGES